MKINKILRQILTGFLLIFVAISASFATTLIISTNEADYSFLEANEDGTTVLSVSMWNTLVNKVGRIYNDGSKTVIDGNIELKNVTNFGDNDLITKVEVQRMLDELDLAGGGSSSTSSSSSGGGYNSDNTNVKSLEYYNDHNGNFYIVGELTKTTNYVKNETFFAKFNSDLDLQWIKVGGKREYSIKDIKFDYGGNIYIKGTNSGINTDFFGYNIVGPEYIGNNRDFVFKLDGDFNLIWNKENESASFDIKGFDYEGNMIFSRKAFEGSGYLTKIGKMNPNGDIKYEFTKYSDVDNIDCDKLGFCYLYNDNKSIHSLLRNTQVEKYDNKGQKLLNIPLLYYDEKGIKEGFRPNSKIYFDDGDLLLIGIYYERDPKLPTYDVNLIRYDYMMRISKDGKILSQKKYIDSRRISENTEILKIYGPSKDGNIYALNPYYLYSTRFNEASDIDIQKYDKDINLILEKKLYAGPKIAKNDRKYNTYYNGELYSSIGSKIYKFNETGNNKTFVLPGTGVNLAKVLGKEGIRFSYVKDGKIYMISTDNDLNLEKDIVIDNSIFNG